MQTSPILQHASSLPDLTAFCPSSPTSARSEGRLCLMSELAILRQISANPERSASPVPIALPHLAEGRAAAALPLSTFRRDQSSSSSSSASARFPAIAVASGALLQVLASSASSVPVRPTLPPISNNSRVEAAPIEKPKLQTLKEYRKERTLYWGNILREPNGHISSSALEKKLYPELAEFLINRGIGTENAKFIQKGLQYLWDLFNCYSHGFAKQLIETAERLIAASTKHFPCSNEAKKVLTTLKDRDIPAAASCLIRHQLADKNTIQVAAESGDPLAEFVYAKSFFYYESGEKIDARDVRPRDIRKIEMYLRRAVNHGNNDALQFLYHLHTHPTLSQIHRWKTGLSDVPTHLKNWALGGNKVAAGLLKSISKD